MQLIHIDNLTKIINNKISRRMSEPLVSVFIISYNQKKFIEETLESVFRQDYSNFEVVISDDASTDGTVDIIKKYCNEFTNLRAIFNNKNIGITKNSNVCLRHCKGKYIAIMGGDDLLMPNKLSKQVKWLEEDPRRVICGHDCEIFDDITGKTISTEISYRKEGYSISSWIKNGMILPAQTLMVRTDAIPDFGFDERTSFVSDWKFCIDILLAGGECGYIPGIYSKYRRHSSSITQISSKYLTTNYKQSYFDQLITLSFVESFYPQYSRDCTIRRRKLFYSRLIDSLSHKDFKNAFSLLSCFSISPISIISNRLIKRKLINLYSWIIGNKS